MDDDTAAGFPWTPKSLHDILGDAFVDNKGKPYGIEALTGKVETPLCWSHSTDDRGLDCWDILLSVVVRAVSRLHTAAFGPVQQAEEQEQAVRGRLRVGGPRGSGLQGVLVGQLLLSLVRQLLMCDSSARKCRG